MILLDFLEQAVESIWFVPKQEVSEREGEGKKIGGGGGGGGGEALEEERE